MTESKPRRFRSDQVSALLTASPPHHHHGHGEGSSREWGIICDGCAQPPGRFAGQAPETFVGKAVQLAFPTGRDDYAVERMWVRVERLHSGDEDEQLEGVLLSQPAFTSQWGDRGSLVAFKVAEIIRTESDA